MSINNITLKVGVDTSQFDSSLDGMKKELRELEKVNISLLSDEDAKKVLGRMGDLKASIGDIRTEMNQADPGNFFNSFSTLAGPAIAGISGLAVGMEMFGVESEKVNEIQKKLMMTISLLSSLQTIADADKLKAITKQIPLQYQELKAKMASVLSIKAETTAVVANTAAKETGSKSIKKITLLQKLWNAAVAANPILIIVAAVAALATGIYLLSKAFNKNTKDVKESEKAMDGMVIKNEALRNSHNETIKTLRDLQLEYSKVTGQITEQEYELQQLNNQFMDNIELINNEYIKEVESITEKATGFWNVLWNTMLSGGDPIAAQARVIAKSAEEISEAANKYNIKREDEEKKHKDRLLLQQANYNKSILSMIDSLNSEMITDDAERLLFTRNQRLKDVQNSKADEELKNKAILLINKNYNDSLLQLNKELNEKQKELRDKSKEDIENWLSGLYGDEISDQEKEISNLINNAEKLKQKLDEAFPTNLDKRSQDYVDGIKTINTALESYTNKINEKYKELYSKELFKFRVDNNLVSLKEMENDEIESLKKMEVFQNLSLKEREKLIIDIKKKYVEKELQVEKSKYERLKNMGINTNKELFDIELRELLLQKENQLLTEEQFLIARNNLRLKYDDEYGKQTQLMKDVEIESKRMKEEMLYTAINGFISILQTNLDNLHQQEMEDLNERYNEKLDRLDKELEYGVLTQNEYNKRKDEILKKQAEDEKKLKEKQAKDQKRFAIFQIAIDTAMSIMKTLATFGLPAATPLMVLAASMGALQSAIVASHPLPKFKTGSKEPFEQTGNAYIHQGEMVVRKEVVDYGDNRDVIRRMNENPIGNLSMASTNGITMEQMIQYVDIAFEKYNQIPVVVKENDITSVQNLIKTIRVNSEY